MEVNTHQVSGLGPSRSESERAVCAYRVYTGSEESASRGFLQDIRVIGQKIVQHKATNVLPVGVNRTLDCGLPEGNHAKILHSNNHNRALIRIRTLEVKEEETIMRRHAFLEGGDKMQNGALLTY